MIEDVPKLDLLVELNEIPDGQNHRGAAFVCDLLLRDPGAEVWRDTIERLQVPSRRKSSGLLVHRLHQPGGICSHYLCHAD